jgi:hypothetical protein
MTVAACVFRNHATPEGDREGCPLVAALARRIQDLEMSGMGQDVERVLDKYRGVANVLACPLIAKLSAQDLRALVVARQINPRSDWARRPAPLVTAPA